MQKNNIANTQLFYLHVVYLNWTHNIATDSLNHAILLRHLQVLYFPNSFLYIFTYIIMKKHNTSRLLTGVTRLKEIFTQKE